MSFEPPSGGQTYDQWLRRADVDAVAAMCRFFMQDDPVHHTLRKISAKLDELGIAYAIAGGMALGAHHFVRATVDVDILVDAEGLRIIHENLDGLGFVPPFEGSRNLKDVETGVRIEFWFKANFRVTVNRNPWRSLTRRRQPRPSTIFATFGCRHSLRSSWLRE
jgi:hypothetical protein